MQEALEKIAALAGLAPRPEWHLIGPLQSNKTRVVAETLRLGPFGRSPEDRRAAERAAAGAAWRRSRSACRSTSAARRRKSGLAPAEVGAVARAVAALPRLRLRGLMAIPEAVDGSDLEAQRRPHRALRALFDQLRRDGLALDTLSAGMSDDLEAAILEGATMVRVGSAIFGGRAARALTQRARRAAQRDPRAHGLQRRWRWCQSSSDSSGQRRDDGRGPCRVGTSTQGAAILERGLDDLGRLGQRRVDRRGVRVDQLGPGGSQSQSALPHSLQKRRSAFERRARLPGSRISA